ncbi:hypothetical protein D6C78_10993 [Aureobasidium pullulans]|uniref:Uncharacterized protein n=1 Tax=Aureobasidium pullulans TaxID=5580 RepID=A0A4T0B3A6_AURPU|nr:hypothetical protein D6C78_10993 [Aureobasidium pullulans]
MDKLDQRPMARLQNLESQERYVGYWKRMLCYCLRVWLARHEATNNDNDNDRSTSDDETNSMHHDGDNVDEDSDSNSTNDSQHDQSGPQPQAQDYTHDARRLFPWNDRLEKALVKVWRLTILERDSSSMEEEQILAMVELSEVLLFRKIWNDRFYSAVLHFMAVMGIDEINARLRDGNDYSYFIAGLVYVSRIVAAETLLPSLDREN